MAERQKGRARSVRTLGRRLALTNAALLVCLLLMALTAGWGLYGLHATVRIEVEEYIEAQQIERARRTVEVATATARFNPMDASIERLLLDAIKALDGFLGLQQDMQTAGEEHQSEEMRRAAAALVALRAAGDPSSRLENLEVARKHMERLAFATDLEGLSQEATRRAEATATALGILAAVILLGSIVVSVAGYRGVMGPVRKLRDGVRRVSRGDFSQRIALRGDAEIEELAKEFNRMVGELDEIYRVLERRVEEKSRELVRSERLASVGFLAAGVAHEINTPLNIISGYAEMSSKWLEGEGNGVRAQEAREALSLIATEALRCREITEQLLSLARRSDESRMRVALGPLIDQTVRSIEGINPEGQRRITVEHTMDDERDAVIACPSELRQVLLNLLVNALDATDPQRRRITVRARREGEELCVAVEDNGVGIDPRRLNDVFEPFYSHKETNHRRGVGIGLTISSAIVESHGGRLTAWSEGHGKGSVFTLRLPAARGAVVHAG